MQVGAHHRGCCSTSVIKVWLPCSSLCKLALYLQLAQDYILYDMRSLIHDDNIYVIGKFVINFHHDGHNLQQRGQINSVDALWISTHVKVSQTVCLNWT